MKTPRISKFIFLCAIANVVIFFATIFATGAEIGENSPSNSLLATPNDARFFHWQPELWRKIPDQKLTGELIDTYQKFVSQNPQALYRDYGGAQRARAEISFREKNYPVAAAEFAIEIAESSSPDLRAALPYAFCLLRLNRSEEALNLLTPFLSRDDLSSPELELLPAAFYCAALASGERAEEFLAKTVAAKSPLFSPLALRQAGVIAREKHRFADAAEKFSQWLEFYPQSEFAPTIKLLRGESNRLAGKLAAAIEDFRSLTNVADPAIVRRARYQLALAFYEVGDYTDAQFFAEKAVSDSDERDEQIRTQLLSATILLAQKESELADKILNSIFSASTFSERVELLSVWNAYENHDYASVIRLTDNQKNGDREDALILAGRAEFAIGNYENAAKNFLSARNIGGRSVRDAAVATAISTEFADQFDVAVAAYQWICEHAASLNDAEIELIGQTGLARSLMSAKRYEASLRVWTNLLRRKNVSREIREDARFQQAAAYFQLKQFANMETVCEELLAEFPQGQHAPQALARLTWRKLDRKQFAETFAHCDKFLRFYPLNRAVPQVRHYRAAALRRLERSEEATDEYCRLIIDNAADAQLSDGEILWLTEQLRGRDAEQATEIFQRLIVQERSPLPQIAAQIGMARIQVERQRWSDAIDNYRQAAALLPTLNAAAARIFTLKNEIDFGLVVAAREVGEFSLAEETLARIENSFDRADSRASRIAENYHYEVGMLAMAKKNYAAAAETLWRVGLLSDNAEIAGKALWTAAEACEANQDAARAALCYEELAGESADSFGRAYPHNIYAERAKNKLNAIAD